MKNLYVSYVFEYIEDVETTNSTVLKNKGVPKTVKQLDAVLKQMRELCGNKDVAIVFWHEVDSDKPIKKTTGR